MHLYTKDENLLKELREAVARIRTVGELGEFLRAYKSPVVADCLQQGVKYFSADLKKRDGRPNWPAVRERKKRFEMSFRLTDDHVITPRIANALWRWLTFPGHGRDLGTGFEENSLSARLGVPAPRYVAYDILTLLSAKGMEDDKDRK